MSNPFDLSQYPLVLIGCGLAALFCLGVVAARRWRAWVKLIVLAGLFGVLGAVAFLFGFTTTVYGYAILADPLAGATIEVHVQSGNGHEGVLLGTSTTGANGFYTITVRSAPTDTLVVTTSGGTYVDEITGATVTAGPHNSLRAVVPARQERASVTPLTTMVAARTLALAGAGQPLSTALTMSSDSIARQYGLPATETIAPTIASDPQDVETTDRDCRDYGLVLGGLDQEASSLKVSDFDLTDALTEDITDGNLDGMDADTPVSLSASATLPADAGTTGLQDGIDSFASSPRNLTHLPAPQVSLQPSPLELNGAGFYVSSPALPAWVEGQAGSARIGATGGTPPYHCMLKAGSVLPAGFALSSGCELTGVAPSLGSSLTTITPPFTVVVFDSSDPSASVEIELSITIVQPSPTVTGLDADCPAATTACSATVATVSGGTPPYYFQLNSFANGAPPLGMTLGLDGTLSGTPAAAGTYSFGVCAIDLGGNSACDTATVTVGPAPTTAPQEALPSGFPTNLPSGTYEISVCASYVGCVGGQEYQLSDDDLAGLNSELEQSIDAAASECNAAGGSSCTVSYTPFNGQYFSAIVNVETCSDGSCSSAQIEFRVTKIS